MLKKSAILPKTALRASSMMSLSRRPLTVRAKRSLSRRGPKGSFEVEDEQARKNWEHKCFCFRNKKTQAVE